MTLSAIDIRRANDRLSTRIQWLDSKHSFSFGHHYDPRNTHHGLLLVNNDDIVAPGQGFDTHPHKNMEIVTWVLSGSLVHQDSIGNSGIIYPGLAQRMSAGTGILHSEKNDSWRLPDSTSNPHTEPVRFVQMWVTPDTTGTSPSYQQLEIETELTSGNLIPVASGMAKYRDSSAITIANKNATLHVARLLPGQSIQIPEAAFVHIFLTSGTADMETVGQLNAGDAVRLTNSGGQNFTADSSTEVLIWEMHVGLHG
ncbi:MAG: pirin family protein [Mycobacteriaceae bacterium]